MKPSKLLPLALLCFAIFGYLSCKKTDPGQVQPSQPTDRFFSLPSDAPKEIRAITRSLQKQNDKYHYLSSITKKAGYPKWDKARIVNFDNKMVTGKGSDAESGEIVYIPFVRDSDNYVNALLAVKMDASDTVYRMLHDYNYRKFGYDTTGPSKWSARDVFNLFVSFDNSVFGHRKFIIEDGKLFGIDTASGFIAELISGINKSTARVSLMEPVEICKTYTVCPSCDAYVRAMKENVLPGSAPCCDPFDVTFCTTYWADVVGGGGGGDGSGDTGGWTGTGDGTGGTSGGGGGTGWYGGSDPCAGSTTPIPRLSTVAPVDGCGSGWTPVQPTPTVYDEAWFNSLPPYSIDVSGLNNYPCAQGIAQSVIQLNNSTIQTIKNLFSQSVKYNIYFDADPSLIGTNINGKTSPNPAYIPIPSGQGPLVELDMSIHLNPDILNRSTKLYIAETMIHEMIHSYFFYRSNDANGDAIKTQKLADELGFLKPWDPSSPTSTYGNQHEQMAASYIQNIVSALKEFKLITDQDLDPLRNTYFPGATIDDFYTAMAWEGLTTDATGNDITMAWHTFKENHPDLALKYSQIMNFERLSTTVAPSHDKCN